MHVIGHGRDGGKHPPQRYTGTTPAVATRPTGRNRDGSAPG
ncbi:hypothetical protein FraQA3DRAFT_0573 [Frankia sp. QA3]|nr:hypothetical protein FraQA3DRAFT_0573 [Frankia sp. QA3]